MSGGCRSLPLLLPPISLQSLEALCPRTFILSFLLLLNKEQQSFKTTEGCRPRKRKAAFAGILGGALPSNHEKLPPKPRVDFPQTTCRFPQTTSRFPSNHVPFPSDHESISLKPRVGFPQITKTAYKWAETRFAGDSGEAVVGTQRG